MDGNVRVGLLGAGGISPAHAEALRQLDGVELVAVCDRAIGRARELQKLYSVPNACGSLEEMLERCRLDAVHILLPPELHVPLAIECLGAGCHVFVEKPLGMSVDECRTLRQAAEKAGRSVGVNHNVVFSHVMQLLMRVVRSGRIGRIEHVTIADTRPASMITGMPDEHFVFRAPHHMVFEFGPHPLSLLRKLIGGPKQASSLVSGEKRRDDGVYYGRWQSSLVCDRGTAQCTFTFGHGYRHFSVDIYGEDGVVTADLIRNRLQIHEAGPYRRPDVAEAADALRNARLAMGAVARHFRDSARGITTNGAEITRSIGSFYDALRRGESPPEGIEEGTEVVAYCEEIGRNRISSAAPHATQEPPKAPQTEEYHVAFG